MTTNAELLTVALEETLACQDQNSAEYLGRRTSTYGPLGAHVSAGPEQSSYPTTDRAMDAIARLADTLLANDPLLKRANSRDTARLETAKAFGELLNDLVREPDERRRWLLVRERAKERLGRLQVDLVHYVPVWLFVGQGCDPVAMGPVRFVVRDDWLGLVEQRRGIASDWMPAVREAWAARRPVGRGVGGAFTGLVQEIRDWLRRLLRLREGGDHAKALAATHARTVARAVHPDQWVACVEVLGFERDESRRRAVLATRVALDTFRLLVPGTHKRRIHTGADHAAPAGIDRFSQQKGRDLSGGWHTNMPGISGAPGLAASILANGRQVLDAAGECIRQACIAAPAEPFRLPILSERWFNAVHWFGRACLADVDYVAIVLLVMALDILSGGRQEEGIAELLSRLTGHPLSQPVLPDGTHLGKLVERGYKLRSEIAHGSILAVHGDWDEERAQLESLASIALIQYVLALGPYGKGGGADDRDAFLATLPPLQR